MSRRRRRSSDDYTGLGCLAIIILGIILMPIAGLVMVLSEDPNKRTLGWILLIGGIILWIIMA